MNGPTVAIVSAIYDRYDTLKPVCPQDGADVDWVLVTDDASLRGGALGWRTVYLPRSGVHPNRAAKHPKFLPWEYTGASASVWVDASLRVVSPTLAVDTLALADPLAQFVHPWRDCLYAEAEESVKLAKYAGEACAEQAEKYRAAGHPAHWGLWATTLIARKHTAQVREFGGRWLEEVDAWTFQDQVSHPYVLRETGLRPAPLPGDQLTNQWTVFEGSERH